MTDVKPMLFVILVTALLGFDFCCGWRDPDKPRTISVTGNHTGALREGDLVELVCTATGILPYSVLKWTRLQGNVLLTTWSRGASPLALALRVTPALHAARFYCSAPFYDQVNGHYFSYTVVSEALEITVEGINSPQELDKPGHIQMESPAGTSHRVGDVVPFSCTTNDIPYSVVDVVQAKGAYESQLHTGWQPFRQIRLNVSRADHGSAVYCRVTAGRPHDYRLLYTLESNRVPVHVAAD